MQTTTTEPKIEWWVTEYGDCHGFGYFSVGLAGEDQFGNKYEASGEAINDGCSPEEIVIITDIEKIEE